MTGQGVRRSLALVVVSCAMFAAATPAFAQKTFGVRGGATADPDQFFFGAHFESPGLTQTGNLTFRPNVEVGFGSDLTIVSGNLEFVYWVRFPKSNWSGYFGGGPNVNYVHESGDDCEFFGCSPNDVEGGFNGLVGFQHTSGLFIELKAGAHGAQELKATVGFVLKKKR